MIVLINVWVGVPYQMIIATGVLMNIPSDMLEASTIDGASPWQSFIHIKLPYLFSVQGPALDPTAAGCGFYTLRRCARPGAHKTKKISQKGLTFCLPCGIILEQSARTAERQKVNIAGWSSLVARRAHNPKVVGSNPAPATTKQVKFYEFDLLFCYHFIQKGIPEHPQMFRYPFYMFLPITS